MYEEKKFDEIKIKKEKKKVVILNRFYKIFNFFIYLKFIKNINF